MTRCRSNVRRANPFGDDACATPRDTDAGDERRRLQNGRLFFPRTRSSHLGTRKKFTLRVSLPRSTTSSPNPPWSSSTAPSPSASSPSSSPSPSPRPAPRRPRRRSQTPAHVQSHQIKQHDAVRAAGARRRQPPTLRHADVGVEPTGRRTPRRRIEASRPFARGLHPTPPPSPPVRAERPERSFPTARHSGPRRRFGRHDAVREVLEQRCRGAHGGAQREPRSHREGRRAVEGVFRSDACLLKPATACSRARPAVPAGPGPA